MTTGLSWQVEGVRPQARETAQEAARRSGMSVGEWLDSVISDSAKSDADEPASLLAGLLHDNNQDAAEIDAAASPEDPAEVNGRLDDVRRRLDQLSRLNANQA